MHRRVCLLLLLALTVCGLAGAAAIEPATLVTPVATAPAAPSVAVPAQPVAVPAWLAPAPNHSDLNPADLTPDFTFRNCNTDCQSTNTKCQAACAGNQSCILDCIDVYQCCHYRCGGLGCP